MTWKIFAIEPGEPIKPRMAGIAAIAMGGPLLAGLATGHLHTGFMIGLGAILLAGQPKQEEVPVPRSYALASILLAVLSASLIARIATGMWADALIIALASIAGLLSGYSRPMGAAAIRFLICLVLSESFLDGNASHGAALVFGLGVLWNIVLRKAMGEKREEPPAPQKTPTREQLNARFRRVVRSLEGWQFPLRLALGLGIASAVRHAWPSHHLYWIMLTVALLTERGIEHLPIKALQRLIGNFAGVAVAAAILSLTGEPAILAILACGLAILVPIARQRSYLLYSIVATPLILLAIDLGRPLETGLLIDRLAATLGGGAIVIAGNVLFDRLLKPGRSPSPSMPARLSESRSE